MHNPSLGQPVRLFESVKGAALEVGYSAAHVRLLIDTGKIPNSYKSGGVWLVYMPALNAYIEEVNSPDDDSQENAIQ